MTWKDITLQQFNLLLLLTNDDLSDEERSLKTLEIIYGDDILNEPAIKLGLLLKALSFMKDEIPTNYVVKNYIINNRKYNITIDFNELTTAQYIDFLTLYKTGEMNKYLSVFFIPDGHSYNDGYKLEDVMDDLLLADIVTINSLSFFFKSQYVIFIKIFQHYSIQDIKKLNLTQKMKKWITQIIKSSTNLVLSHLS